MYKINLDRKWGVLDPEGEGYNPLTGREYQNLYYKEKGLKYSDFGKIISSLPVYKFSKKIINEINKRQIILIVAGTGSGKTVLVPKFALHVLNYKEKVLVTIPQTSSVESTSRFAIRCHDVKLGTQVGFFHGQEKDKSKKGSILNYTSTGSLAKILQNSKDPFLKRKGNDYKIIIIDEAHQRDLQMDELLLLVKQLAIYRPDIKIIIMTATVDINLYKKYYNGFNFGILELPGETTFPIKENWLSEKTYYNYKKNPEVHDMVVKTIIHILKKGKKDGHILVFVKSAKEAPKICDLLESNDKENCWLCTPLDRLSKKKIQSEIGPEVTEQDLATEEVFYLQSKNLRPGKKPCRKIIISTNVAESSLTVKNVDYVIDCGTAWVTSYDPSKMLNKMNAEFVAKSSIIQRKGRTGRTRPGEWFPLYHKSKFSKGTKYFSNFPTPDIQKEDLTVELLSFLDLPNIYNVKDLKNFLNRLLEPPKEKFINSGLKTLSKLGAITSAQPDGKITNFGKLLKSLRIKLIYGYCLVSAYFNDCFNEMCKIIACCVQLDGKMTSLLSNKNLNSYKKYKSEYGDHLTLLNIYNNFESVQDKSNTELLKWSKKNELNLQILKNIKGLTRIEKKSQNKQKETRNNLEEIKKNFYKVTNTQFKKENGFTLFSIKKFIIINRNIMNKNLRILKCLFDGHRTNTAIKSGKSFVNIFPIKKTKVNFDMDFGKKKTFCNLKNDIYFFDNLFEADFHFNGPVMLIVSSIPPTLKKYMKFDWKTKLENSLKTIKKQSPKRTPKQSPKRTPKQSPKRTPKKSPKKQFPKKKPYKNTSGRNISRKRKKSPGRKRN